MPFRSSSIQSKLLEHEYGLSFSNFFTKSNSKPNTSPTSNSKTNSEATRKDSMAGRNSTSAEEGLLSQSQTETPPRSTWRYRAKRTIVVLMFVMEMAICAMLGMLLCMLVVWIGRAFGWRFVGGGIREVDEIGDEWDD